MLAPESSFTNSAPVLTRSVATTRTSTQESSTSTAQGIVTRLTARRLRGQAGPGLSKKCISVENFQCSGLENTKLSKGFERERDNFVSREDIHLWTMGGDRTHYLLTIYSVICDHWYPVSCCPSRTGQGKWLWGTGMLMLMLRKRKPGPKWQLTLKLV